ncbi:MAG TPA: ATP-binding protein [Pyrinomonadaceae bacterium]|nr:ATP-binding protein [Pyrinomonadaceae bacterium]
MRTFHSQEIRDESQVGAARRGVRRFASPLGFTAEELAEIDIVVQEMGTNAVRYAPGGGRVHWTTTFGPESGLELFYWDKGPGIDDLDRAVRDGVSSGGGLGAGFGAIQRLSDEFEVYSTVRGTTSRLTGSSRTTHGTSILCRKWAAKAKAEAARAGGGEGDLLRRLGAWSRCRSGEHVNGDAYFFRRRGGETLLAVVDGLGHGGGARQAAEAAVGALEAWNGEPLDEVILAAHDALRATRGGVIGAVIVSPEQERFYYAGVGNIEVRVFGSPVPARPVPSNGTLGLRLSQVRVWPHQWAEGTTFVLASDGVSAKWDIESYPGILKRSPQLLAGLLMRDYGRDSDDATALVAR